MKKIQSTDNFSLTRAFVIGDKRSLKKKQKESFSILQINHLFTPSGIHFSSFYLLFIPFIKSLRKKGFIFFSYALELTLCLIPFGLNQLYSLKRISLLRITNLGLRPFKFKIDFFYIFLGSFIFDFFFGTFKHSPMSFAFSFLFIGSLLSTSKRGYILVSFFVANLLISFFFYQEVNLLGFILGFFITGLFSILFPFIFITYWPSSIIGIDLTAPFIYLIKLAVSNSSKLAFYSPNVEIDLIGLIFLLIFSFKRRLTLLILSLIFTSCRIYNIPKNRIRSSPKEIHHIVPAWKVKKYKQFYKRKGLRCVRKIILNGHQISCRNTDHK